jgi:hypothetical protein
MTNEQRIALRERLDRMEKLNPEVRKVGDRAQATGDLSGDLDNLYTRVVFNMGRAYEAGLAALGELEGDPPFSITMTDPDKIIERCDQLIDAAEGFIFDVRHKLGAVR